MLTQVDAVNSVGATLALPLGDTSNGFTVRDIQGLDPVPSVMVSSSISSMDGEQHQASRRGKRNLIFKIGVDVHHSTVRELRAKLYKWFMPKMDVRFRFYDDEIGYVDIRGKVESFEMPLFAKEPEATISVLCYDPDFYVPTPVVVEGLTTPSTTLMTIKYDGTVESGFIMRLTANRTLSSFEMVIRPVGGAISVLNYNKDPILSGDVIEISTIPGSKRATRMRGGATTSVLYGITPGSRWLSLQPGDNLFQVKAEGTGVPFTIDYTPKLGGL